MLRGLEQPVRALKAIASGCWQTATEPLRSRTHCQKQVPSERQDPCRPSMNHVTQQAALNPAEQASRKPNGAAFALQTLPSRPHSQASPGTKRPPQRLGVQVGAGPGRGARMAAAMSVELCLPAF